MCLCESRAIRSPAQDSAKPSGVQCSIVVSFLFPCRFFSVRGGRPATERSLAGLGSVDPSSRAPRQWIGIGRPPRPRPPRCLSPPLHVGPYTQNFPKFPKERPKNTANPKAGRGWAKKRRTAGSRAACIPTGKRDLPWEGLGFGRVRPPAHPNFAHAGGPPGMRPAPPGLQEPSLGGCRESAGDLRRVVIPSLAAKPGSPRVFFFSECMGPLVESRIAVLDLCAACVHDRPDLHIDPLDFSFFFVLRASGVCSRTITVLARLVLLKTRWIHRRD